MNTPLGDYILWGSSFTDICYAHFPYKYNYAVDIAVYRDKCYREGDSFGIIYIKII